MSLRLWRVVWGRLRTDWPFLFACWLLVATATTLVTAGALYADTVELGGVRRALAEAHPADQGVLVRLAGKATEMADLDAGVRPALERAFGATGAEIALTARSASLKPALGGQPGVNPAQSIQQQLIVLGAYDGLDAHAVLVDGHWPAPGQAPIEAALSEAAAAALGLNVGSTLQLADAATPGADSTAVVADLKIVGTWKPKDRAEAYWLGDQLDLDGQTGTSTITRGPVIVDAADLPASTSIAGLDLRWRALPALDQLRIDRVDALRAGIGGLPGALPPALPAGRNMTVTTQLADVLGTIDRSVTVSRSGVVLVILQFALLAGYAVLLAGALLFERRRPEVALLRARGARGSQVGLLALAESAVLAVPAAVLAPLIALGVIGLIGRFGAVGEAGIISAPALTGGELVLTAAACAACVVALSLPALVADVDLAHVRAALGRPLGRNLAQRIGLDLVLGVLTVIGLFQLQSYGSLLARGAGGQLTIDPVLVAAPALSLAAGALLVIRIVPRIGEVADWLLRRRRGLIASLASRQIARRPLRYTRSALLIVLAAALATFAASYVSTWAHSQADQAAYLAGADMRLPVSQGSLMGKPEAVAALPSLAGVRIATPVVRDHFSVGQIVRSADMLVVDSAAMAEQIDLPPEAEARGGAAAIQGMAAGEHELVGLALPPDTKRLGIVLDIDLHPAEPDLPHVIDASEGQGFDVTADVMRPDSTTVALGKFVQSFNATEHRVEFSLDELKAGAGGGSNLLLDVAIDGYVPLPMIGQITIRRVEASASAAGDADWTPVADASVLSDWSFEDGGATSAWDIEGPLFPRDATRPPPTVTWGPAGAGSAVLNVIAGDAFLAASGTAVGDSVALTYHTATFEAQIVGALPIFPSLDPNRPFLILDLPSLRFAVRQHGLADPAPSEWWLWLEPGREDEVTAALAQPPFGVDQPLSQARLRQSLERDPVALGLVGALTLGSLAAAVCAAVGLVVGAIVSTRERMGENALLRALGMSRRGVTAGVLIDNGYLLAFGLPAGLALGALIGWLVLPNTALNSSGARVVPSPIIVVPLEIVAALGIIGIVLLAITVFAAGRAANAAPIADVLRSGDA